MGRRLKKTVAGTTTWFQYADEGLVAEYDAAGSTGSMYGWQPDGIWGTHPQFKRDAAAYHFYHNDHLGTPQRLSDVAGNLAWSGKAEAFGKTTVDIEAVSNPLRFPGQYFDAETGTHYNFYRDYSPSLGRYVKSDPLGLRGGINSYVYGGANSLTNVDPLGRCHYRNEFDKRWEYAWSFIETLADFEYDVARYEWDPGEDPNWEGVGKPQPPLKPGICSRVVGFDRWHVRIWRNVDFYQLNLYMRRCKDCGSCDGTATICEPWEKLGPIGAKEKRDFPWYTWDYEGFFPTSSQWPCVHWPFPWDIPKLL
jgi:RHS repeat-associated protein